MIKNRKFIGVCLNTVHDSFRSNYVNELNKAALALGYKLLVFNSYIEFERSPDTVATSVSLYDFIDFKYMDAVVVLYENFLYHADVDAVIARAHKKNIPVVLINAHKEGCFSVSRDFDDAFKGLMRHVIVDHGITDTFFMAGLKSNTDNSFERLRCYKEVLCELGLTYDESRVGYGEYWEGPTNRIVDDLCKDGKQPPRAIFCANDSMALAVCERLKDYGYSVPEDVVVTGFDGLKDTMCYYPSISTCREDMRGFARLTMKAIVNGISDNCAPNDAYCKYTIRMGTSCGCKASDIGYYAVLSKKLLNDYHLMNNHNTRIYAEMDVILRMNTLKDFVNRIPMCLLYNSYVCIAKSIIDSGLEGNYRIESSDTLDVIASRERNEGISFSGKITAGDLIPDMEDWLMTDEMYLFTPIYVDDIMCGYYATRTSMILDTSVRLYSVSRIIDISLTNVVNKIRQSRLKEGVKEALLTDPTTGLLNLMGLTNRFVDFSADTDNHGKFLVISVFEIQRLTQVVDTYGLRESEDLCKYVSLILEKNTDWQRFIGRISNDQFCVVSYFDETDAELISAKITKENERITSSVSDYVSEGGFEYCPEINSGSAFMGINWQGSLEGFIKFATGEMYKTRLKYANTSKVAANDIDSERALFERLISDNKFTYVYQPIVDVHTGDIYGYEALMRTYPEIGLNPLQVLEYARKFNRMYDIEIATVFNILDQFKREHTEFNEKKIFINTIPGYFLNSVDKQKVVSLYKDVLNHMVVEITEENTITDEELDAIKSLGNEIENCKIAVDDYGTGHSNIVNLLRYEPQVIKIDRYLISNIQNDVNKQMFVSSTVDFAQMNDIKVLAEGVETSDEMRTVIRLGVDYIQGYYTGKPLPHPVERISDDIRREMAFSRVYSYKN